MIFWGSGTEPFEDASGEEAKSCKFFDNDDKDEAGTEDSDEF